MAIKISDDDCNDNIVTVTIVMIIMVIIMMIVIGIKHKVRLVYLFGLEIGSIFDAV